VGEPSCLFYKNNQSKRRVSVARGRFETITRGRNSGCIKEYKLLTCSSVPRRQGGLLEEDGGPTLLVDEGLQDRPQAGVWQQRRRPGGVPSCIKHEIIFCHEPEVLDLPNISTGTC